MKKLVFETNDVNLKEFLKLRFAKESKPELYMVGDFDIPMDISSLLFATPNDCHVFYSMYTEDEKTIEQIEFKNGKIKLISEVSPSELLSDYFIKELLRVSCIKELSMSFDKNLVESLLKSSGFSLFRNRLESNLISGFEYRFEVKNNYVVISYDYTYSPELIKEESRKIEHIISSLLENITLTTPA